MSRHLTGDDPVIGRGLFVSKNIFGYMSERISTTNQGDKIVFVLHLICSEKVRQGLEKMDNKCSEKNIKLFSYDDTFPWKIVINPMPYPKKIQISSKAQVRIVESLVKDVHLGACALVSGAPGSGKTYIADLVAVKLSKGGYKPSIINGFNPTKKGNSLRQIIHRTKPSKESPLILCFNEFDKLIQKVHDERVVDSEHFNINVVDKSDLSNLLDEIAGLQNVIVIATTNQPLDWFKNPVNSYVVRDGRFSHLYELESLSAKDAIDCFLDGCDKYGIEADIPDFKSRENITLATLANAFYRCHGDAEILMERLGF
jgi:hypothetical protein